MLDAGLRAAMFKLQQAQLAGARHSFGAPLNLQLVKDDAAMPFNRAQREKKLMLVGPSQPSWMR
jgi:hypothetical protein